MLEPLTGAEHQYRSSSLVTAFSSVPQRLLSQTAAQRSLSQFRIQVLLLEHADLQRLSYSGMQLKWKMPQ
jgi:hypothetical protein